MSMPAEGLWTVRLAVTRRVPVELDDFGGGNSYGSNGNDNSTLSGGPVQFCDSSTLRAISSTEGGHEKAEAPVSGTSSAAMSLSQASRDTGFAHDPTDWVSIRMGPSLNSLSDVGSVKNVVNDDLGEVSHVFIAGNQDK